MSQRIKKKQSRHEPTSGQSRPDWVWVQRRGPWGLLTSSPSPALRLKAGFTPSVKINRPPPSCPVLRPEYPAAGASKNFFQDSLLPRDLWQKVQRQRGSRAPPEHPHIRSMLHLTPTPPQCLLPRGAGYKKQDTQTVEWGSDRTIVRKGQGRRGQRRLHGLHLF